MEARLVGRDRGAPLRRKRPDTEVVQVARAEKRQGPEVELQHPQWWSNPQLVALALGVVLFRAAGVVDRASRRLHCLLTCRLQDFFLSPDVA